MKVKIEVESVRDRIGILVDGEDGEEGWGWMELILISRGCINRRGFFICGMWLLEDWKIGLQIDLIGYKINRECKLNME